MIGAQPCAPPLIGITFLGSSQWSIRSAQCCISFVREPISASESRRERLFSRDTNKNANKLDGCGEFLRVFSTRHENFPENMESNQQSKLLLLFMFSVWC